MDPCVIFIGHMCLDEFIPSYFPVIPKRFEINGDLASRTWAVYPIRNNYAKVHNSGGGGGG